MGDFLAVRAGSEFALGAAGMDVQDIGPAALAGVAFQWASLAVRVIKEVPAF